MSVVTKPNMDTYTMLLKSRDIWFSVERDDELGVWIIKAINLGNTLLFEECHDLNTVQSIADSLACDYFDMLEEGEPDRIQKINFDLDSVVTRMK